MLKQQRIEELEKQISLLPQGTVVYKNIRGNRQPYLQWRENGKLKSLYLKAGDRERIIEQVAQRKKLTEELKALQASASSGSEGENTVYRTHVMLGAELERLISSVRALKKRDCFSQLQKYVNGNSYGKVCLLYGLRRTGKTTLLFQTILEMTQEERAQAVYIKARTSDSMADMNQDLRELERQGYRYIFIDEVTLLSDFIDSAALFSDIYAMQGMKIVLSGTDSLGFWFTLTQELYDRAFTIHTTFIPFREYSRLLGIDSIDEYIRYGGTLQAGELAFDDEDALQADAAFRDDETTRRYIDTAICNNIQHSLVCCERGNYFRHLRSLYEAGELTGAINRIIESMNHQFLLRTLTQRFKSHDLGSAAEALRKQPDSEKRTDILDRINREAVTEKLMEMLEIRNEEDRKIGITEAHVSEIKEYLKALDLIVDCPAEIIQSTEPVEHVLFTQPGMRYCQAQALVFALMHDDAFSAFSERERSLACEKILEEVRGRMMEDIVLLETARSLSRLERAFKLVLGRSEYDMVIFSSESLDCEAYEIKHSDVIVPRQYHVLEDPDACQALEHRYGPITRKCVIYRGENRRLENGVEYQNVADYLKRLGKPRR